MGPSPGNWLAAHRAVLTLGKTAICIFVAKFYGRMPFLSQTQTLSAVQELRLFPTDLGCVVLSMTSCHVNIALSSTVSVTHLQLLPVKERLKKFEQI